MTQDGYFCPEQVLQLIPPQSCMLQTDMVCRDTMSRAQNVGEKLNSGWRRGWALVGGSFHPEPTDFLDFRFTN